MFKRLNITLFRIVGSGLMSVVPLLIAKLVNEDLAADYISISIFILLMSKFIMLGELNVLLSIGSKKIGHYPDDSLNQRAREKLYFFIKVSPIFAAVSAIYLINKNEFELVSLHIILLMLLWVFFAAASEFLSHVLLVKDKLYFSSISQGGLQSIIIIFMLYLGADKLKFQTLIYISALSHFINSFIMYFVAQISIYRNSRYVRNSVEEKKLFKWQKINSFLVLLFTNLPILILDQIGNSIGVLGYSVAERINRSIGLVQNAILSSDMKTLSILVRAKDRDQVAKLSRSIIIFSLAILLPGMLIIISFLDKAIQEFFNLDLSITPILVVLFIFQIFNILIGPLGFVYNQSDKPYLLTFLKVFQIISLCISVFLLRDCLDAFVMAICVALSGIIISLGLFSIKSLLFGR